MVFVRKVRTTSGATAVQIAERQVGRDKVLEHLGSVKTNAELTSLLEAARAKIYPGQGELDLAAGSLPAGQSVITGKPSALLWHVLSIAYTRLGFDVLGDEAFKQLVLARLVEPTSKADSVRVPDEVGVPHASLRTMFRCLGRAQERGYRDQVAAACFAHAAVHGDLSLVLIGGPRPSPGTDAPTPPTLSTVEEPLTRASSQSPEPRPRRCIAPPL